MVNELCKYVDEAVRICSQYVAKNLSKDYRFPKRAENPFSRGYCPELNASPILGPQEASYYQSLIEVMRWMLEVGCIDINTKVSLLSSYLAILRQEHLKQHFMS